MLSPISLQTQSIQQAQSTQPQAQAAAASLAQPAALKPDTVRISSQGQAGAVRHDGDGDGH